MAEELSDVNQQLQFEREEKVKAIAQVESLCAQAGKLGAELEAVKAAGVDATGDIDSFKKALEEKQTEVNKLSSRIDELEAVVARLSKERDLINKKMDRVQAQKDAETSALKQQLEASTGAVQSQINERDRRINELMEELGNREVCTCLSANQVWRTEALSFSLQPNFP
jgi:chromosome segregation ATPase